MRNSGYLFKSDFIDVSLIGTDIQNHERQYYFHINKIENKMQ